MKKKLLAQCLRIAQDNLENHPQKLFFHWAFIIQNNKILGYSVNMNGEPPVHFGYHQRIRSPEKAAPKLHAEYVVFKKCRGLIEFTKRWDVVNIRLNKSGNPQMSAPCNCCYMFLTELGCHSFWYTTACGWSKTV
jgi:hypothetical protein